LRVVRANKKTMSDKTPAPAFSLPHTTLSQSQAWLLRNMAACGIGQRSSG
jgi:hypothetical protein